MSVESMAIALHHSAAKGTVRCVLVGIGNHDGDGGSWPSMATLAKYGNCDRRAAQRAVEKLEQLGEIRVFRNAGGTRETRNDQRPNRYEFLLACPPGCDGTSQHRVTEPVDNSVDNGSYGAVEMTPREDNGAVLMTQRGGPHDTHGAVPAPPEPSLNHPEPAAARSGDLPEAIEQLRAGFAAHPALDSISFTMRATDVTTVAALIERHGVARLVRAALDTKTGPVRRATAFIETWSELVTASAPRVGHDAPELCPVCGRTTTICDAANRLVAEENRCTGRETA